MVSEWKKLDGRDIGWKETVDGNEGMVKREEQDVTVKYRLGSLGKDSGRAGRVGGRHRK